MDKANIIISIIIVLCVAAAVAAYGLTNSDNPIFSGLSSMSSNTAGSGVGNSTAAHNGTGTSSTTGSSSSGSGSSGGSSSGTGTGGGSGSSGSGGGSGSNTHLSYSEAQSIANGAIGVQGSYAANGYYSGGYWYFTIYDANGNNVDIISVNDATGATGRG